MNRMMALAVSWGEPIRQRGSSITPRFSLPERIFPMAFQFLTSVPASPGESLFHLNLNMEDKNENEEMFNRQRRQITCVDVAYFASHTHVGRNVWTQRRTRCARRPG